MLGKILFITSRYGGLPQGMINSLKRMNTDYIESPLWNMEESYDKFQPQVVIFFHHFLKEFDKDTIDRIEKITCHKILWDWECPWEIDYIRKYHHFFSKVLLQDKASVEALKSEDPNKFIHVPHAADKDLVKTINVPFEYRSDLCFIGAAYPSRLKFFREVLPYLKDYKVVIGGTGWEFLPDTTGQKIINTGLNAEEYIKYYSGTNIALNLHRLSDEMPIANKGMVKASSPNNRFFELNMMGCCQFVDDVRQPELRTYFQENIIFNSNNEFIEKFLIWIKDKDLQKEFKKQVRQEAFDKHSYERRFIDIIAKIV